jgi:hypothetical protein
LFDPCPIYPLQFATLKVEGKKSGASFAACALFISTAEQFRNRLVANLGERLAGLMACFFIQ